MLVHTPVASFPLSIITDEEADNQQRQKGLFKPRPVWLQSLCLFHSTCFQTSVRPGVFPKVGKLIRPEVGMYLAPGPLVSLISLLLQTGGWEAAEKDRMGKNYSTAGACLPPVPWPSSSQQSDDV